MVEEQGTHRETVQKISCHQEIISRVSATAIAEHRWDIVNVKLQPHEDNV